MAITIELPADLERELREREPDLDARIRWAVALNLYRSGAISIVRLADLLPDAQGEAGPLSNVADNADGTLFKFTDVDLHRCDHLSAKAGEGSLSADERHELEAMTKVDTALSLLRLKAMRRTRAAS